MSTRLGLDLGTNSLGWALLQLDEMGAPCGIITAGARIFSDGRDPKSGASLAADRRLARSMRRRRDRFLQRKRGLLKHLTLAGLFPEDAKARKALAVLDPFELRARALYEALPLDHLGRALFHINQRRGFKSNRKAERGRNDESGKIRVGVQRLHDAIQDAGAETFGEFLHMRRAGADDQNSIRSVRTRLRSERDEGARGDGYDFYPDRQTLIREFNLIWKRQAEYHADVLTPEAYDRLFEVIFHQRPLKAPKIGKCTLLGDEERLPKAHPLFQRRRLLEEVNALRIKRVGLADVPLTRIERDLIVSKLKDQKKVTFKSLRRGLKLDPEARFNKESDNRKDLAGDEVAAELSHKSRFGPRWQHLDADRQWEIVSRIREQESDEDEADLIAWLVEHEGLSKDAARATAGAYLPEGYGRFGLTATKRLIEALESDVIVYSEAVQKAGFAHHSDFRTGELLDALPYYGVVLDRDIMPGSGDPDDPDEIRFGRLTNPTVHIGLNQLRRVVNALIRRYGRPDEIALELARELKLDDKAKNRLNERNRKNREAAVKRSEKLTAQGIPDTGANRARLKLWEELNPENCLDRRCPYSGVQINLTMLFSDVVDIDHILPFTQTLDDSNNNKTICLREANRLKRNRSPFEAALDFERRFGERGSWEAIAARAALMPPGKQKRFEPDALRKFREDDQFLARQLTDTQYLSRLARTYLCSLYPEKGEDSSHVWVSPGQLTEMVRRKLGLNDLLSDHNTSSGKNRLDHRHHTIDAIVVAIVDRALLNAIARASGEEGRDGREKIVIPEPWENFREDVRAALGAITVSHRPDHGSAGKALAKGQNATAGRLHNDTAYGLTGHKDAKGNDIVVHRIPFSALTEDDLTEGGKRWIVDDTLRRALADFAMGKTLKEALHSYPELAHDFKGIRRVRVAEPLSVIPIRDRQGRAYKGYKGDSNYRYDVWEMKDGKWQAEVVSMFDAHQPDRQSAIRQANPTARKVLSLHQDDLVAIERDAKPRQLMRVVKFGQNGQVTLAEHQEAGDLKRRDEAPVDLDPFKYFAPTAGGLKKVRARQVRVDELGRVFDPSFPARKSMRRTRPKAQAPAAKNAPPPASADAAE